MRNFKKRCAFQPSRYRKIVVLALMLLLCINAMANPPRAHRANPAAAVDDAACRQAGPMGCLKLALEAMGGQARLEGLKSVRLESVSHTFLMEQSYRQEPFIASYERAKETRDVAGRRIFREAHITWPESDPGQSENVRTLIVGQEGGVYRTPAGDRPCSVLDVDNVREAFAIGPERLLLTALTATDLRFEAAEEVRSTPHTVLAFTWEKMPVRVLINSFNHLPDAVETVQQFHDFWGYWGDVKRRLYFDNWQMFHGLIYPTNIVDERNGAVWQSTQIVDFEPNIQLDEAQFRMDAKVAARSVPSSAAPAPVKMGAGVDLVPGVSFFEGSWNTTIVKQDDGVVILEAPISSPFAEGLIQEAKRRYPGLAIKAALSTSDSWPHIGGVRQCVANSLPVFILDLNRPLLDRFVEARHTIRPDLLAQAPKAPQWRIVSGKVTVGTGANRMELYPLRGADTERQYMVYFPEHRLLYASDTIVINQDGTLYAPELGREVAEAVKREGLQVTTVFAMHQAPTPWVKVTELLQKASN